MDMYTGPKEETLPPRRDSHADLAERNPLISYLIYVYLLNLETM